MWHALAEVGFSVAGISAAVLIIATIAAEWPRISRVLGITFNGRI